MSKESHYLLKNSSSDIFPSFNFLHKSSASIDLLTEPKYRLLFIPPS